ncbi:hypothetical protein GOV04_03800 [Candidatus Woesearchaeota archaeon]|nr:hypothetical protein [Candidatus Woesearchaeota archaeon]
MIKAKTIIINISLLIFVTVLLFAIFEISLRLFYPQGDIFYRFNPVVGWDYPPNKEGLYINDARDYKTIIQINSFGFRDEEFNTQKSENEYRIILLGDSQTASFEVPIEKRFDSILEEKLNNNTEDINYKIYNLGVQGYSTDQEYFTLRKKGLELKPDLVILLFHPNDFQDNSLKLSNHNKLYFDKNLSIINNSKRSTKKVIVEKIKEILRNNFYTYKFVGIRIKKIDVFKNTLLKSGFLYNSSSNYLFYQKNPKKEFIDAENITYQILKLMDNELNQKNVTFLIVLFDVTEQEVQLGITQYSKQLREKLSSNPDFDKTFNKLKFFLIKNDIAYFDTRYATNKFYQENNESLTFNVDSHLNEKGHVIMAQEIYNYLQK